MAISKEHINDVIRTLTKKGDVIFLESQSTDHPASKQSFLAALPEKQITIRGRMAEIREGENTYTTRGNAWDIFQQFIDENDWLFGYLGYDLKNHTEDLVSHNEDLIGAADLHFMVPGLLLRITGEEIEFLKGSETQLTELDSRSDEVRFRLKNRISRQDYIEQIRRAKHDIREGRYYEINLSHPLKYEFSGDPLTLYEKMKASGPVPFGAYMKLDGIHVVSASPERFLKKEGDQVLSQPIKGTAPRDDKYDEILKRDLRNSEKERAENLMIVDLVRNDLNRIAEKGSVEVIDLFEIQSFKTVHQMVSTVKCRAKAGISATDIIRSCFPMGSMTGAPKIAAMKAIEKYEEYKRGIYSGAIGYIDPEGDFDFNVVIRSAIIKENTLIYPVGGAITSDSVPEDEWLETLHKSKALTQAE
ncbi:aminodeoxychorismate synthase component I [Balneola sp. MJW-20]|uniref:aminodeoxychorismate synthase component I n=1 Tax=Gracilimonas aurantiaca TaxID=3234185 RepID=UPI003465158B